ncbi:MAG: hypothetical protein P1V36_09990 [Planctomycetota bacterium]|nr:hypothetical protein [Planctomycetota bacterium]
MKPTPPPLPTTDVEAEPAAPKTKRSPWKIVLIVVGLLVGLVALLVLLGGAFLWLAKDLPVEARDREVLLSATEIGEWIEGFEVDAAQETWSKVKHVDGSFELSYTYMGEELSVDCFVGVDRSATDAKMNYTIEVKGEILALELQEIDVKARAASFSWGDESKAATLLHEDEPLGNFFACRRGTRTFRVWWSGCHFEDSAKLRELLEPVLARWARYRP